jgi:hypothetical protein
MVRAKDIQLFNPDILGQPTSNEIKLLRNKETDEVEPFTTLLNIRNGVYIAATIMYPSEVTFQEARDSLNRIYKNYEQLPLLRDHEMAVWRIENRKYAVDLIQQEDKIRIMYIQFQSKE